MLLSFKFWTDGKLNCTIGQLEGSICGYCYKFITTQRIASTAFFSTTTWWILSAPQHAHPTLGVSADSCTMQCFGFGCRVRVFYITINQKASFPELCSYAARYRGQEC